MRPAHRRRHDSQKRGPKSSGVEILGASNDFSSSNSSWTGEPGSRWYLSSISVGRLRMPITSGGDTCVLSHIRHQSEDGGPKQRGLRRVQTRKHQHEQQREQRRGASSADAGGLRAPPTTGSEPVTSDQRRVIGRRALTHTHQLDSVHCASASTSAIAIAIAGGAPCREAAAGIRGVAGSRIRR